MNFYDKSNENSTSGLACITVPNVSGEVDKILKTLNLKVIIELRQLDRTESTVSIYARS